jgi:hypothetical protein
VEPVGATGEVAVEATGVGRALADTDADRVVDAADDVGETVCDVASEGCWMVLDTAQPLATRDNATRAAMVIQGCIKLLTEQRYPSPPAFPSS